MPNVYTEGLDDLIAGGVTVTITQEAVHLYYETDTQEAAAQEYAKQVRMAAVAKADQKPPVTYLKAELHQGQRINAVRVTDQWFRFADVLKANGVVSLSSKGIQIFWDAESKSIAEQVKEELGSSAVTLIEKLPPVLDPPQMTELMRALSLVKDSPAQHKGDDGGTP